MDRPHHVLNFRLRLADSLSHPSQRLLLQLKPYVAYSAAPPAAK